MKASSCLFDTHALIFWANQTFVSKAFIRYFDNQAQNGYLHVSSVSFWEAALLAKKAKIRIPDICAWKKQILNNTGIQLLNPSASEMVQSVLLPDHHKDPFDRLLIAQANHNQLLLVTMDKIICKYPVETYWM